MRAASKSDLYRKLPSVDETMRQPKLTALVERGGRVPVTTAVRAVLERLRREIEANRFGPVELDAALDGLPQSVEHELNVQTAFSLRGAINATGVILHTNLGRAPLAEAALDHIRETAAGYSNLEFDLEAGTRGERDVHVDRLFRQLFAEAAPRDSGTETAPAISSIVVNNNAAAVWLALNTLAAGGEVVVSRGELVEIGGSFRIPDVMAQSNAILREVGTTNRTRVQDYERAINGNTRALLRVHRSNFEITGFTEQPALGDLATLARERGIPLVEDLGSGALLDMTPLGITGETGVAESLRAGVDVITYSGDKLLGGPQAGILTGRVDLIRRMRSNSLFRALRVDKLTYAALEATLLAYLKRDHDAIPALRMMRLSQDEIGRRVETILHQLRETTQLDVQVVDGESVIGGGAAPSSVLQTRLLTIAPKGANADGWLARLLANTPPVIARVEEGRVVFDLRTVFPQQDMTLVAAIRAIAANG